MSNHPTDAHLHIGNSDAHAPGMPVVAVIGDGQLARMMHTEAIELGQSVRLLAGARDASAEHERIMRRLAKKNNKQEVGKNKTGR